MHTGTLEIDLHLPGCSSLKDKRSRLKPLLARLHREFNVSAAEIDALNAHRSAVIACAVVSNDAGHVQRVLENVLAWIERYPRDLQVVDHQIRLL